LKTALSEVYCLHDGNLKIDMPKHMLSLDLGTGYFLAMIHDVQGKLEMLNDAFYAKEHGKYTSDRDMKNKFLSTVYFAKTFDITKIP